MMGAGRYGTRFEHFARTTPTANTFGEKAAVYTSQGYLWGALEDLNAGEETQLERPTEILRATITLRNYPTIAPLDKLVADETDWIVRSRYAGDNEIICDVEA